MVWSPARPHALTSELIKADPSIILITMARYVSAKHFLSILWLFFVCSSFLLATDLTNLQTANTDIDQTISYLSDVSPSIYDWGIIGRPNMSEPFTVWANVTDDDFDLANVSVHVVGPNTTINNLLIYNGSFYVADLEALLTVGTYDIYVTAMDLANNSRTSRHLYIQIQANTISLPDPSITMPYVIIPSILVGLISSSIAYLYSKREREKSTN